MSLLLQFVPQTIRDYNIGLPRIRLRIPPERQPSTVPKKKRLARHENKEVLGTLGHMILLH